MSEENISCESLSDTAFKPRVMKRPFGKPNFHEDTLLANLDENVSPESLSDTTFKPRVVKRPFDKPNFHEDTLAANFSDAWASEPESFVRPPKLCNLLNGKDCDVTFDVSQSKDHSAISICSFKKKSRNVLKERISNLNHLTFDVDQSYDGSVNRSINETPITRKKCFKFDVPAELTFAVSSSEPTFQESSHTSSENLSKMNETSSVSNLNSPSYSERSSISMSRQSEHQKTLNTFTESDTLTSLSEVSVMTSGGSQNSCTNCVELINSASPDCDAPRTTESKVQNDTYIVSVTHESSPMIPKITPVQVGPTSPAETAQTVENSILQVEKDLQYEPEVLNDPFMTPTGVHSTKPNTSILSRTKVSESGTLETSFCGATEHSENLSHAVERKGEVEEYLSFEPEIRIDPSSSIDISVTNPCDLMRSETKVSEFESLGNISTDTYTVSVTHESSPMIPKIAPLVQVGPTSPAETALIVEKAVSQVEKELHYEPEVLSDQFMTPTGIHFTKPNTSILLTTEVSESGTSETSFCGATEHPENVSQAVERRGEVEESLLFESEIRNDPSNSIDLNVTNPCDLMRSETKVSEFESLENISINTYTVSVTHESSSINPKIELPVQVGPMFPTETAQIVENSVPQVEEELQYEPEVLSGAFMTPTGIRFTKPNSSILSKTKVSESGTLETSFCGATEHSENLSHAVERKGEVLVEESLSFESEIRDDPSISIDISVTNPCDLMRSETKVSEFESLENISINSSTVDLKRDSHRLETQTEVGKSAEPASEGPDDLRLSPAGADVTHSQSLNRKTVSGKVSSTEEGIFAAALKNVSASAEEGSLLRDTILLTDSHTQTGKIDRSHEKESTPSKRILSHSSNKISDQERVASPEREISASKLKDNAAVISHSSLVCSIAPVEETPVSLRKSIRLSKRKSPDAVNNDVASFLPEIDESVKSHGARKSARLSTKGRYSVRFVDTVHSISTIDGAITPGTSLTENTCAPRKSSSSSCTRKSANRTGSSHSSEPSLINKLFAKNDDSIFVQPTSTAPKAKKKPKRSAHLLPYIEDEEIAALPKKPQFPRFADYIHSGFYECLIEKMQPKYGIQTNAKVVKLAEYIYAKVDEISWMGEHYPEQEVLELARVLAQKQLVQTHYDFWFFCWKRLPECFMKKAFPLFVVRNGKRQLRDCSNVFDAILSDEEDGN